MLVFVVGLPNFDRRCLLEDRSDVKSQVVARSRFHNNDLCPYRAGVLNCGPLAHHGGHKCNTYLRSLTAYKTIDAFMV